MDVKGYWTVKQTSKKWGITERRILTLCHEGRIEGVVRFGNVWAIPEGTPKPVDARIKTGKYIKQRTAPKGVKR